jgi:serine/threonine protein phosphatase PrpC
MRPDVSGATTVGKVRKVNQDQFLIAELTKALHVLKTSLPGAGGGWSRSQVGALLLAVADGVGGGAAGERASALAVKAMVDYALHVMPLIEDPNLATGRPVGDMLQSAAIRADGSVHAEAREHPEERGMATTLTVVYVVGRTLHGVHVGDSRAYLVRAGKTIRLTRDHNVAQRLVEEGVLTPEGAGRSRMRHVLWNAVGGTKPGVEPDTFDVVAEPGDVLLLCTDGLDKHVDEPTIARLIGQSRSAEENCQALIDAADAGGGTDNTAVVVARFPAA